MLLSCFLCFTFITYCTSQSPDVDRVLQITTPVAQNNSFCVAFSPYVEDFNPNIGRHPPVDLIATLLDRLVETNQINCIYTYGSTFPLDSIPRLAAERGLKVIQTIWLDADTGVNQAQINRGIELAEEFPDTIIAINCGSEVRLRIGEETATPIILDCIEQVREAGVVQPVTHSATWIEWCDMEFPDCSPWQPVADSVDIILATVFAWWENLLTTRFPCIPPDEAGEFAIEILKLLQETYPDQAVMLSEFGWPSGPEDFVPQPPDDRCADVTRPGKEEQLTVVGDTLSLLAKKELSGIAFSAFEEPWKEVEGPFGEFWGICSGTAPYTCEFPTINCYSR